MIDVDLQYEVIGVRRYADTMYIAAKVNGKEIGHVYYDITKPSKKSGILPQIRIDDITVNQDYQGQKVATQLVQAIYDKHPGSAITTNMQTPDGEKLFQTLGIGRTAAGYHPTNTLTREINTIRNFLSRTVYKVPQTSGKVHQQPHKPNFTPGAKLI